ncbi:hypothetical protein LTR28_003900 [Elasticomyces elasticus]|nr:hypothetical protein LTR28_003900 [Elasticomyces elasticus]
MAARIGTASPLATSTEPSVADYVLRDTTPAPQSTACGYIVNTSFENDWYVYDAKEVLDCLVSVPFDPAVAARFVRYINDTLQFQTTLAYLEDPPSGYQQPAVDLIGGLNTIQRHIDSGVYKNEYAFETAVQRLLFAAHDAHVNVDAGVLSSFVFGSGYRLVTLSDDGIQLPKVYFWADLVNAQKTGAKPAQAIAAINGQDTSDFLTSFAATNSMGTVEPHADWNQLMTSPAQTIQGAVSVFTAGAKFYPGDTIAFTMEDGTQLEPAKWLALYFSPGNTGPLLTGGDFYNFFVLGFYPPSYNPDAIPSWVIEAANASPSSGFEAPPPPRDHWEDPAYPEDPFVVQPDLATDGTGFVTGYYLQGKETAVLSIPSFQEYGTGVPTFSKTIGYFVGNATAAGVKKVVIDLQQNGGGDDLLAYDAFQHFFPNTATTGGSRMRAHEYTNAMGETLTDFWESRDRDSFWYYGLSNDEWVAPLRLNATGQNFRSWQEFYGLHAEHNDNFTFFQQYDLSNVIFDKEALGGYTPYGYADNPANSAQPWDASNIVILTDGLCSSTCTLFVEMMHYEQGVKTVVVGGRPEHGPMQAASGSRGAASISIPVLDENINFARALPSNSNPPADVTLPANRDDSGVYITSGGINLRDQVRNGSNVPLQFLYDAADCRIFLTKMTFNNYAALWQYAADAIWTNSSKCVPGSTGYAVTHSTDGTQVLTPPKINTFYNATEALLLSADLAGFSGSLLPDVVNAPTARGVPAQIGPIVCNIPPNGGPLDAPECNSRQTERSCIQVQVGCDYSSNAIKLEYRCVQGCHLTNAQSIQRSCNQGTNYCIPTARFKSSVRLPTGLWLGYCDPPSLPKSMSCAKNKALYQPFADSAYLLGAK